MRVLLLSLRADLGGGPLHMDLLIKHLPAETTVYVACPPEPPYYERWSAHPRVQATLALPHRRFTPGAFFRLLRFVKNHDIKVVHSHGRGAGLYGRLLRIFRHDLRIVHTFHGVHLPEKAPQRWLLSVLERGLAYLTDRFIHVSHGEQALALQHGFSAADRSVIIPNGIADPPRPATQNTPDRPFTILYIGRFDPVKNVRLAIDIALATRQQRPVQLLLVGDGPDRAKLEEHAAGAEGVRFLGPQTNVYPFLESADVVLLTSHREGLPYVLIEAAAFGIPTLATDVTGNNEVVVNGESGYLFPPSAPELAVARLVELFDNPSHRAALGRGARRVFEANFQIQGLATRIFEQYAKPQAKTG